MHEKFEKILFEINEGVATITLNRPEARNALDEAVRRDLDLAIAHIEKGSKGNVHAAILTGSGGAFCAGGDMDWFQEMIDDPSKFRGITTDAKRIVNGLLEMEKPIICRLNGAAAGLGASIALLCDIIIADERALIGDPHVKVGLVAA